MSKYSPKPMAVRGPWKSGRCFNSPRHQRGIATLVVALVLLIGLTLMVFSLGRVGLVEQTITGNEQRALKVNDAAEAGLEHGMTWLARNFVDAGADFLADGTTAAVWPKTLTDTVTPGTGESYSVNVTITPAGTDTVTTPSGTVVASPYLLVSSTAVDANDASVVATVSQQAVKASAGTSSPTGSPPLVLNGCFSDKTTGGPDIIPASTGTYAGDAILAAPVAMTLSECAAGIDPVAGCACPVNNGDRPHFDVNGGDIDDNLATTAWDMLYPGMSKAEFQAMDAYEDALMASGQMTLAERNFIYINSAADAAIFGGSLPNWHQDLGSGTIVGGGDCGSSLQPDHMVMVYFGPGAGCPKPNGNPTIWGLVYVEGDCSTSGQGWGGAKVIGSVGIEGNMETLNSNAVICGIDMSDLGGLASENKITTTLVRVPGTWSDM